MNQYNFWDKLVIAIWLLRTKLLCPRARLIRFPFDLRGKKYIDLGVGLTTGVGCRIEAFPQNRQKEKRIVFGHSVQINDYVHISAMDKVVIGNNVLMASHIYISDNSHGTYKGIADDTSPLIPPIKRFYSTAAVYIGDNVWIGEGVFVAPGVTIGKGCVIGAHSFVNKNIPDYCIAAGSPARIIKRYNFNTQRWEKQA